MMYFVFVKLNLVSMMISISLDMSFIHNVESKNTFVKVEGQASLLNNHCRLMFLSLNLILIMSYGLV